MVKKTRKNLLKIGEAAYFIGVSQNTLRLWDTSGKLKAQRSAGGHRYYSKEQLSRFIEEVESVARSWAESPTPPELSPDQYCETQDVFKARLDTMSSLLSRDPNLTQVGPLVTAVAGEIGNNSFDHNFGNWPDVPGIFFSYDTNRRLIVLADRGQGVRATLLRVRPELADDISALTVAFTERISARAPEQRGNGLKFVRDVAVKYPIGVSLQSGTAVAEIAEKKGELTVDLANRNLRGTLATINY